MLVTTMTTPDLQDLIKKSFITGVKKKHGAVRRLFHKAEQSWETKYKVIKEIDRERLAERKLEGQASAQRGMGVGYEKKFVRNTISITRKVSGEEFKALKAHNLAENVSSVGEDLVDKIELDMRNVLTFGKASSYTDNGGFTIDTTVGDGLPLFSTTHTLKFSSKTYSNILSGAPSLSEAALEVAEDFFTYNVMDNYGVPMAIKPNTIITSEKATMVNRVKRLLLSVAPEKIEGNSNSNSGVVNTYKSKYQHLAIAFDVDALGNYDNTKSYWWFLAAVGGSPRTSFQAYYVKWLSPEIAKPEIDQDRWVLSFTGRAAYALGAVSGKGIVLSEATS